MGAIIFVLSLIYKLLVVLLTILIIILIIPFQYEFNGSYNDELNYDGNVLWAFRFFKVMIFRSEEKIQFALFICGKKVFVKNLHSEEVNKNNKDKQPKIKEKKTKEKSTSRGSVKEYFEKRFLRDIIAYFKEVLEVIKPKSVKIHGIYGFQDPSITGILCGFIPLISLVIPNRDIMLEPVFDDDVLELDVSVSGKIILGIILVKTLALIFKESVRKKIFKRRKKVETY
ncbi:MAG: DUF2953 domain-containing protein [Clostridiaceae bacterium]